MARRYLRGGLVRFLNRDLYLDGERSFLELSVTVDAARSGVPTAEALAAVSMQAAGLFHRCFLFTRELPGCIDLPAYLRSRAAAETFSADKCSVLKRAAAAVRLMHERGFLHADLNMKNILVDTAAPEQLYIIDWDKSRRYGSLTDGQCAATIIRFCRSMTKLGGTGLPVDAHDAETFLRAYRDDEQFVAASPKRLQRTVALRRGIWKILSR